MTVGEIEQLLYTYAPADTAEPWDHIGLMVGDRCAPVRTVVVCLDITEDILEQAIACHADLIITHHPFIFTPLSTVSADSLVYRAVCARIAVLSMHTNLDKAVGGVNDALAASLHLRDLTVAPDGMCRIGTLSAPMNGREFAALVADTLHTVVRVHSANKPIYRVAVCGGSGGDVLLPLCGEADALLTGEFRHHEWLECRRCDVTAVEAGHHATEVCVVDNVAAWVLAADTTLRVVLCKGEEPYEYYGEV